MEPRPRSSEISTEHIVVDVRPPELDPPVSSEGDRDAQRSLSRETSIWKYGTTVGGCEPEALLEIGNLIRIRGLPDDQTTWLRVALEEWGGGYEKLIKRRNSYRKNQNVLHNEIYRGVGLFSAFQGLLLTAVAQSTLLSCKNLIFPFLLSVIATVTAVALVFQKNSAISYWESCISEEEPARKVLFQRVIQLRRKATAFDFREDAKEKFYPAPKRTIFSVLISYGVGIISILIIFGVLCLLAMHRILCDSGSRCSR